MLLLLRRGKGRGKRRGAGAHCRKALAAIACVCVLIMGLPLLAFDDGEGHFDPGRGPLIPKLSLRGGNAQCPGASPGMALLYIGSDVDMHVLHYLEDNETHAVFIDPFPGDNRETKSDEAGANELVLWEKRHKNDPRISFRRSTRGFRPWKRSMRRSFSRFVMARLMDEGFKSVCSPQPMEFAFLVRGIRRRLSFLAGDTAPMRYQTSAVCDSGVRVSTVVSIGVALDNDHPHTCGHLERLIYTRPFFSMHNTKRLEVSVWRRKYKILSLVEVPDYPGTLAGSGAHVVELRIAPVPPQQ